MSQESETVSQKKPIYERFPPALAYSQNPTDGNIDAFSCPYLETNDSFIYSEKSQNNIATDATRIGGIKLYDLVFILAKEGCYNEILSKLWDYSGFNNDRYQRFPKWEPSFVMSCQIRSLVWYWLLCRWTIFEKLITNDNQTIESYYFSHLKKIPLLFLYNYINSKFGLVCETEIQSPEQYIKLDELEKYLKSIAGEIIPLPILLYPDDHLVNKNLENLIREAQPEIEMLYGAIKRIGFSSYLPDMEKQLQEAVLKKFDRNEKSFKVITRDHLMDREMYSFAPTNEKRDFIGSILQKIIDERALGHLGKQNLYKSYKSIIK